MMRRVIGTPLVCQRHIPKRSPCFGLVGGDIFCACSPPPPVCPLSWTASGGGRRAEFHQPGGIGVSGGPGVFGLTPPPQCWRRGWVRLPLEGVGSAACGSSSGGGGGGGDALAMPHLHAAVFVCFCNCGCRTQKYPVNVFSVMHFGCRVWVHYVLKWRNGYGRILGRDYAQVFLGRSRLEGLQKCLTLGPQEDPFLKPVAHQ